MRTVPAGTGRAGPAVKARVSCRPALSRKAATHRRADGCNLNLALYDIAPGFGPGWGLGQTKSRTQQDQARASSDRHRTVALTWAHGLLRWVGQGAMPRSLSFGRYPFSARCPHRAPRQCPGSPRGTRAGPDCENGCANGRIESDFFALAIRHLAWLFQRHSACSMSQGCASEASRSRYFLQSFPQAGMFAVDNWTSV